MWDIRESLSLLQDSFGVDLKLILPKEDLFISHEGLLLDYESALTHPLAEEGGAFNTGAHLLWIGERTRALDGAHLEYFRGILNPIAVKLGPTAEPEEVLALSEILNPRNEPGRLMLIPRL